MEAMVRSEVQPAPAAPARSIAPHRVADTRRSATAVWLASTRPDGRPHLLPLWFAWDGDELVVLSKPHSQKVRNIRRDPRVVLAFGSTEQGMEVDIVEGEALVLDEDSDAAVPRHAFARYEALMRRLGLDLELFFRTYSQPIRIRLHERWNWGQAGWSRS